MATQEAVKRIASNAWLPTGANPTGAAVLNLETGLVWDRCWDFNPRSWTVANDHCASRNVGGRFGWSLPMREQLASLLDTTGLVRNLPNGHLFTLLPGDIVWSATTHASNPTVV